MTCAGVSVFVYGILLAVLGAVATFWPAWLLSLLSLESSEPTWIRLTGWLTVALGLYYIAAAWRAMVEFYFVTVVVRIAAVVAFIVLVYRFNAPVQLLLFALTDGVSALITQFLLWQEAKSAAARAPEIARNPG
jgi:hypothetical protein